MQASKEICDGEKELQVVEPRALIGVGESFSPSTVKTSFSFLFGSYFIKDFTQGLFSCFLFFFL